MLTGTRVAAVEMREWKGGRVYVYIKFDLIETRR